MIDYELAKELKDAGFPQTGVKRIGANGVVHDWHSHPEDDLPRIPTLEELIEACGDNFLELKYWWEDEVGKFEITKQWRTTDRQHSFPNWSVGSTPAEAVARLWLALSKK